MTPTYQPEKLAELMLYVADRSVDDPTFGATKLNKILYFSDFIAYTDLGDAITGARYQKLPNGPAPRPLLPIQGALIRDGEASLVPKQTGSFTQKRLVALRSADLSVFTPEEISLVDRVIEALKGVNATAVSEMSHRTSVGWCVVDEREDIPYTTAFLAPADTITDEEFAAARAFSEKYQVAVA